MSTFNSTPIQGKYILVTGGAGYIGSHTVLKLLKAGHDVVIVDNLSNSCEESLRRVEIIAGKKVAFHKVDILDKENLNKVFDQYDIWAVIHFAGLKSVFESIKYPQRYMHNNVEGTRVLLECMNEHNVYNIVFSSSATLYGGSNQMDNITEDCHIEPINPYGESKWKAEQVITENCKEQKMCQAVLLRYFNPIGAHCTGLIGENPKDIPNNLMPYVCQTLVGRLPYLNVFGNDYPTRDGTGVRDYIHVVDLADGHLAALEKLKNNQEEREQKGQTNAQATLDERVLIFNMGTGTGYSVMEIVENMGKASGKKVPYKIAPRRSGDAAQVVANPGKANRELLWKAQFDVKQMCEDAWKWQSQNPEGYEKLTPIAEKLLNEYQH